MNVYDRLNHYIYRYGTTMVRLCGALGEGQGFSGVPCVRVCGKPFLSFKICFPKYCGGLQHTQVYIYRWCAVRRLRAGQHGFFGYALSLLLQSPHAEEFDFP